jgi:arginyl-tRNA synthetase
VQLVKLLRAGEPVKMSKRAGELVTLREVVDEVGPDAVRFMMLFRKNDAVLDFDLAKVLEQSRDNPAAAAHEPHRIAFYLYDLASDFHALWTLGNASPHLRFIIRNDRQMTMARLVLVQGVVTVLGSGLLLLGVGAPNEMR